MLLVRAMFFIVIIDGGYSILHETHNDSLTSLGLCGVLYASVHLRTVAYGSVSV